MYKSIQVHLKKQLQEIAEAHLFKHERIIASAQERKVSISQGRLVINLCANNYLGLSNHPQVVQAAIDCMKNWGYGLSSVRFICGTQQIHKELEASLSQFFGMEDTILYSSCFDANGGLFETILGKEDAIISDQLNHASIIDGIRLCKAQKLRYKNSDMEELESCLRQSIHTRFRAIVTDGVFSMDGHIAKLGDICDLADRYEALVIVDDSHGVGVLGSQGQGSIDHCEVQGRVDIVTGTLGKALGGASGGYTSGKKEIIEMLRQRSRPNLFSNSLPPAMVGGALQALAMLKQSDDLLLRLRENTVYFRKSIQRACFDIIEGDHPIVPIMFGDAALAEVYAEKLLEKGIYVIAFSFPVVPQGKARIRVQISAVHTKEDLDAFVGALVSVREELFRA